MLNFHKARAFTFEIYELGFWRFGANLECHLVTAHWQQRRWWWRGRMACQA